MLFLKTLMNRRILLFALCLFLLTACASAPVQEMSDARQALRSAEVAGAAQFSPAEFDSAKNSLRKASEWLDRGLYRNARIHALTAREQAIEAREAALRADHEHTSEHAP